MPEIPEKYVQGIISLWSECVYYNTNVVFVFRLNLWIVFLIIISELRKQLNNLRKIYSIKCIIMNENGKIDVRWRINHPCFVGFFDIMGFRNMVRSLPEEEIYNKMRMIKDILSFSDKQVFTRPDTKKGDEDIYTLRSYIFSDSIILFSRTDSVGDGKLLLSQASLIMGSCLAEGIPLKGALSFGDMVTDHKRQIFFGQPLIDAYELQEQLYLYGAILDESIVTFFDENKVDISMLTLDYNVPFKTKFNTYKLINIVPAWPDKIELHRQSINNFQNTDNPHVYCYAKNTIEFIDYAIQSKVF